MFYGERIKQLREMHKLTQTALIQSVPEITQSQLSRIEKGRVEPTEEIAALIAANTGVTIEFIMRTPDVDLRAHTPQFRARSRVTEGARNSALQWARLIAEQFERLSKGAAVASASLRQLYGASPRDAAQEVRNWLGFNSDEPMNSLILDVERLGVTVLGLPISESNIDAFCAWRQGVPTVCLLDGVPGDRLRFTVAHELGHLVLHDGQRSGQEVEQEADAFAAELLTPIESIRHEFPHKITLSTLTMMKTTWGVSLRTLIRRARELNLVDQDRAIGLYKQISARGWNRAEPGHVPIEKPRAFRKLAEAKYGPGPNIPLLAREAAWSEELAFDVIDRHAKSSELPFLGPNFVRVKSGNVIDFQARRAVREG